MSGDIGRGATREAIAFAVRVAAARDKPQGFFTETILPTHFAYLMYMLILQILTKSYYAVGFLQLAGGTNAHTVDGLRKHRLFQTSTTSSNHIYHQFLSLVFSLILLFYDVKFFFQLSSSSLANTEDKNLRSSSPSCNALIGGVAYGGYARKVSLLK